MHAEWNQVELDVHRTLARFPPNTSDLERRQLQTDLIPMIVELLYSNQAFRYYQGLSFLLIKDRHLSLYILYIYRIP